MTASYEKELILIVRFYRFMKAYWQWASAFCSFQPLAMYSVEVSFDEIVIDFDSAHYAVGYVTDKDTSQYWPCCELSYVF